MYSHLITQLDCVKALRKPKAYDLMTISSPKAREKMKLSQMRESRSLVDFSPS